ncbi:MAG: sigma-54-dependent Fis family transcriptional regulator, partial [Ignavibacteria bacterium 13_1_40CM_2_61_4]
KKLSIDNKLLQTELSRKTGTPELIGDSKALKDVIESARRVAASDSIVLIYGLSGTGKELFANLIHRSSARGDRPFVPVNCSSIPDSLLESELFGHEKGAFTDAYQAKPGLVEVANGGTLFLDEVGDISPIIQPKLLRFLETSDFRRVGGTVELKADVRVISATNKSLQEEARAGRFREDLLYRLNVVTIRVPPLKDHREDVPKLVEYFLKKKSRAKDAKSLTPRALEFLMTYDWPGNVRELEHIIEGAILLSNGQMIDVADLHLNDRQAEPVSDTLAIYAVEKQHIEKVLKIFKGNRKKTAEALNISEKGLYLKIKEYGIVIG